MPNDEKRETPEDGVRSISVPAPADVEFARVVKTLNAEVTHESFSGPIPPGALARDWETTVPGAGERILKFVLDEQAYRQEIGRRKMSDRERDTEIGAVHRKDSVAIAMRAQTLTFVIALAGIGTIGAVALLSGKEQTVAVVVAPLIGGIAKAVLDKFRSSPAK